MFRRAQDSSFDLSDELIGWTDDEIVDSAAPEEPELSNTWTARRTVAVVAVLGALVAAVLAQDERADPQPSAVAKPNPTPAGPRQSRRAPRTTTRVRESARTLQRKSPQRKSRKTDPGRRPSADRSTPPLSSTTQVAPVAPVATPYTLPPPPPVPPAPRDPIPPTGPGEFF